MCLPKLEVRFTHSSLNLPSILQWPSILFTVARMLYLPPILPGRRGLRVSLSQNPSYIKGVRFSCSTFKIAVGKVEVRRRSSRFRCWCPDAPEPSRHAGSDTDDLFQVELGCLREVISSLIRNDPFPCHNIHIIAVVMGMPECP